MPTGQVLRWHFRIMMQPSTISGAVAKPIFFRAKQRRNDDIATGLHLPIGFDADATAQIVEHQRLMRFGQAPVPKECRRT